MPRAWRFLLAGSLLLASCVRTEPERRRPGADVYLPRETETIESTVPRHATLDSLLRAHHLQERLVVEAVAVARAVFDPRRLRADRPYRLVRSLDGLLREFEYQIDARSLPSDHQPRSGAARRGSTRRSLLTTSRPSWPRSTRASTPTHPSLIASIDAAGEKIQLALELAEVFSGQVDFQTELQPGDSFRVLFEKSSRDGQFSGYGAILGASITVDGRRLQAFRWIDPATGKAGVLRRERPLAEAVLPEVAAQVRAARDVAVLDAPLPSDRSRVQGAPRRRLRRADRIVGGRGGERAWWCRPATAARAATRCT